MTLQMVGVLFYASIFKRSLSNHELNVHVRPEALVPEIRHGPTAADSTLPCSPFWPVAIPNAVVFWRAALVSEIYF